MSLKSDRFPLKDAAEARSTKANALVVALIALSGDFDTHPSGQSYIVIVVIDISRAPVGLAKVRRRGPSARERKFP